MSLTICNDINDQSKKNDCLKQVSKKVFGTQEWADQNANFIDGCNHDCKYCYSKEMAIRFHRKAPRNWKDEEIRKKSLALKFKRREGTIMFPSSHDIHPDHLKESLIFLEKILIAGNRVLVVSKPHLKCIKEMCNRLSNFKDNILFRFTIGSSDSKILKFWEPGAPPFEERLASLKWAYNAGFETSISCEPMLDAHIGNVIEQVLPFVTDYIWIGKANFLLRRLKMNAADDPETMTRANELIQWQSDENIIDLYKKYIENNKLKWKESIKRIVGIEIPAQKGLDV